MTWSLDRIIALPGVRWAMQLSPEGEIVSQVTRGHLDQGLAKQLATQALERARELAREHALGIVRTVTVRAGSVGTLVAIDPEGILVLALDASADLQFLREELHRD
ncbi:MAG: hypothetical protein HY335_01335 [Deinococcus sp.]|nr:hypothetical protein [Deinococcus sp.]